MPLHPITEEYSRSIGADRYGRGAGGADGYSRDAGGAAEQAKQLIDAVS
ncbi:MAG: hypothetical protein ACLP1E_17575 [Acidimicrobiales bacterium]